MYEAHHFGDKLHLDQNEKLVMYGVTEVLAIDGYSRKSRWIHHHAGEERILIYDKLLQATPVADSRCVVPVANR